MIGAFIRWNDRARESMQGWVVEENSCHTWAGTINSRGYGLASRRGRTGLVHRMRYELEIGPIPEGMVLDHYVCENTACCNPLHVRPVSPRENVLRGDTVSAANAAKTHCKRGHPLSGLNLVRDRVGARQCRICCNAKTAKRRARRRAHVPHPEAP